MGAIERKIDEALRRRFSDIEVRFDHKRGERISGFLISNKFSKLDHEARQGVVWKLLRTHLSEEEQRKVLGFLIYTPSEIKSYREAYSGIK